ncbi:hypothetical protein D9756_011240 [Leucocoprinus leucothites]|uniref:Ricin B lectin domain-containing protein n=1 Tax=Leucocoprinus leucothites TaxID=201217 RepID=A0A8H5CQ80_9AGAR|nr:hypothetical protein D9756_011240 [Leucoagaricus leucothites]
MSVREVHSGRRYRLTNGYFTDQVLNLSTSDHRSIIRHGFHGGDNQKWEFLETNDGWYIKNVSTGLYVAVEGPRNSDAEYANWTKVVGSQEPFKWHLHLEVGPGAALAPVFRVQVPRSDKRLEFGLNGATLDGIVCLYCSPGVHQRWSLVEFRRVMVIAGVDNDRGAGAAVAHRFAGEGYAIALVDTPNNSLDRLQRELSSISGVEAATFLLQSYSAQAIVEVWESIKKRFNSSSYEIRVGIWNSPRPERKRFLDITPDEIEQSTQANIVAAVSFARQAILAFRENTSLESGSRKYGTLIFTGGTESLQINAFAGTSSLFQCALRFLSQTLNKEFGPDNIHVAHVILGDFSSFGPRSEREGSEDLKQTAESIAKSYLHLVGQDRSAWTWELDLRPAQSPYSRTLGAEIISLLARVDGPPV